ncbi:hypothetical protein V2K16_22710 [Pseudomonas alliivorans]|uniref:hypothetical protein n=1 Tax=Pseudomonas alliivorans TaxID=2810613 RepID=UPI001AE5BAD9|nr:hypothetical protein [Pseudomonas alliivorans]MBP0943092.1 hypothetical protein [Pseudomonas alliivorans]MEE4881188.1 hypothetical protein [Pseudomonas alliivorans]MEE4932492.1 hypothetical protein [Pseudomonas alliivorans]MEE4937955.1 hypothetical protein [Pseudomonas alliivorans]MEE4943112.1 hypothetical protein [Pseudomonas alliivorans]
MTNEERSTRVLEIGQELMQKIAQASDPSEPTFATLRARVKLMDVLKETCVEPVMQEIAIEVLPLGLTSGEHIEVLARDIREGNLRKKHAHHFDKMFARDLGL